MERTHGRLAMKNPNSVLGLHINYVSDSFRPFMNKEEQMNEEVLSYHKKLDDWASQEGGYANMQATKPLTVSYGLNDSPVALCAWIVEKFNSWSDNNGYIESIFTKDEILANVTLYWVTQSIYSSVKIYQENSKNPMAFGANDFVKVPVAYSSFPKEISKPPFDYMSQGFNVVRWTDLPKGGHFAAMEQPELLAHDIKEFFSYITNQ